MIGWVEHIAVIVKIRKKSQDLTWVCTTLSHLWHIVVLYLKISPPLKILWCMKCCLHSSASTEKDHIFDGTIFDASNTFRNWKQSIIENILLFCWIIFVIGKLPFFIVIGSAKYIRNSPDALFCHKTGRRIFWSWWWFYEMMLKLKLGPFQRKRPSSVQPPKSIYIEFSCKHLEFPRNILVVFWPCCLLVYNLGSKNTSPRLFFWRKRIGQVKMVTSTTFCYSYKTESSFQRI